MGPFYYVRPSHPVPVPGVLLTPDASVQIRRGSFHPRLAFFTKEHVPAGCELTYDYGAAGAAGGAPHEDYDTSQPDRKAPRRSSAAVKGAVAADDPGRCGSPDDTVLPVSGVAISSGSGGDGGSADGKSDPLRRRPCLCGARRCRTLLPCNRAIL